MTRRRDMMCEDIFGCKHEPEIPISHEGQLIAWRCVCGARHYTPEEVQRLNERANESR